MRGRARIRRRQWLLAALLAAYVILTFHHYHDKWTRVFAASQLDAFMGQTLTASIGGISGGIMNDITLNDVVIRARHEKGREVFDIKRIELPYRLWELLEFSGARAGLKKLPGTVAVYLSEDNVFVRGYLELKNPSPGEVRLSGFLSPALFGQSGKERVAGTFKKTGGIYDSRIEYGPDIVVKGELDPAKNELRLTSEGVAAEGGAFSVSARIMPSGEVRVYARMDRLIVAGRELIGDVWTSFEREERIKWFFSIENLLIDRREIWPASGGGMYDPSRRKLTLESASWGDDIAISGNVEVGEGYPFDLDIRIEELDLEKLAGMLPPRRGRMTGRMDLDMHLSGKPGNMRADGRLYMGRGALGDLEFTSLFATIRGELPVISVVDARVIKEAGALKVDGTLDLRKFGGGDPAEDLDFITDHRVAVWEGWQINKWDDTSLVEARKDNMILRTRFEEESEFKRYLEQDPASREMSFEYRLDRANSIKMDLTEDGDFLGLKHRVEF